MKVSEIFHLYPSVLQSFEFVAALTPRVFFHFICNFSVSFNNCSIFELIQSRFYAYCLISTKRKLIINWFVFPPLYCDFFWLLCARSLLFSKWTRQVFYSHFLLKQLSIRSFSNIFSSSFWKELLFQFFSYLLLSKWTETLFLISIKAYLI